MKEENACILLTATVTPNTGRIYAINDANIRRQQYIDALTYYIKSTKAKIVFVENSGASDIVDEISNVGLSSPPPHTHLQVEFLIYQEGPESNGNTNKGYKEMKLMEYAWKHSMFIAESEGVIKITGRLKCLNINSIIRSLPSATCWLSATINFKHTYTDARLFALSYSAGHYLFRYREDMNSAEIGLEDVILKTIDTLPVECNFHFMPRYPRMDGIGGGNGTYYNLKGIRLVIARIKHFGKMLKNRIR